MSLENRDSIAETLADLRTQVDEISRGIDHECEALAKAIAERLVPNSPAASVVKATDETAEDRLAAKIAKAMQPSEEEKIWEAHGVDPALAGMFSPAPLEETVAKAIRQAPTREDLRKAYEAEGVDPALAGMFEPLVFLS